MKILNKKLLGTVQVIILAVLFSAVGGYVVYAGSYAEPACAPTGCNADAPINVSSVGQIKNGGLTVAAGAGVTNGFIVVNGNVGLGTISPNNKLTIGGDLGFVQQAGDEANAGRLVYRAAWDPSSLSIVGAGTEAGKRIVHIYDQLNVDTICSGDGSHCITVSNLGSGGGSGFTCNTTCSQPYVAVFSSGNTLNNGSIQDSGTNVGIGTTAPSVTGSIRLAVSGNIQASGFFYSSDRSLKTNISPLQNSLNKILQLQGVSFNWKKDGRQDIGVIAQDVEKVYPELVGVNDKGEKTLEYGNLVAPLIEAVKAQQKQIDQLKAQIQDLQNKNSK